MIWKCCVLCFSVFLLKVGFAMHPLQHLEYGDAFSLQAVYDKHRTYLEHIGSADNAVEEEKGQEPGAVCVQIEQEDWADAKKVFEADCLTSLKGARRRALLTPLISNTLFMGAVYVPPAIYIPILGGIENLAAALSLSSTVFLVAPALNNIFTTVQNFFFTPNHVLDGLEPLYATRQHLIPRNLWPWFQGQFTYLRHNFSEEAFNKLSFGVDLTLCQHPPIKEVSNLSNTQAKLSQAIEVFFQGYETSSDPYALFHLKAALGTFLASFAHPQTEERTKPIYLYGPPGLGKTHFVTCLGEWLTECFPKHFRVRQQVITEPEELEGGGKNPGLFLNVLRESSMGERDQGCILFLDEADWLGKAHFSSKVKRTFNGNYHTLRTRYFGDGIDGQGLSLPLPPLLVILAGNSSIEDEAIRSRFNVIAFPEPKEETFQVYARHKAKGATSEQEQKLLSAIKNCQNFRQVDDVVQALREEWKGDGDLSARL